MLEIKKKPGRSPSAFFRITGIRENFPKRKAYLNNFLPSVISSCRAVLLGSSFLALSICIT
jgi:hypothetical protein